MLMVTDGGSKRNEKGGEDMKQYYDEAVAFCSWAEQLASISAENATEIILEIMKMYSLSSSLTLPEATEDQALEYEQVILPFTTTQSDGYWEIFDPFICDEPVCGSLRDDICSIYNDIRKGNLFYEAGYPLDAQWEWKWSFENHWRYHAVDAIRALNSLKDGE